MRSNRVEATTEGDDVNENAIASRLRMAREQAGLSQGQVARLMDLHRPTISEIEAGRRRVTAEELAEFARHYDVDPRWLLGTGRTDTHPDEDRIQLAARELSKLKSDDLDVLQRLLSSLRKKRGQGPNDI
jgi:transcriptional regulator with XRE-family HTH domain